MDIEKAIIYGCSVVLCLILLCSCSVEISDEEYAAYRESCISRYEVCSVTQYIDTRTNRFGGIIDRSLCYAFTYLDQDGTLKTVEDFQNLEYGLTKVCIGESNQYVIDEYGETKEYLYLTRDTLVSISGMN